MVTQLIDVTQMKMGAAYHFMYEMFHQPFHIFLVGGSTPLRKEGMGGKGRVCTLCLLKTDSKIEAFYVELNIRKMKWLLCCSFNPNITFITKYLAELFSSKNDNFILLGDCNSEP